MTQSNWLSPVQSSLQSSPNKWKKSALKSSKEALRVLLDTTFILPTLGIDVGREVSKAFQRLDEMQVEIHYSRYSILESLWVAARTVGHQGPLQDRIALGLRSVLKSHRYVKVDEEPEIFIESLKLHGLGHKDTVDNILYASSKHYNLKLLTVDKELRKFVRDNGLKDTLIFPDQLESL
jgi:predicted nucleic acid-binding protein